MPHLVLEALAYFIAGRLYWRERNAGLQPPPRDRFLLLGCAVFGAALGAKVLHILEHLPTLMARADAQLYLAGKSVLGGFLGGTAAVELGKRLIGWRAPTGDAWVAPIAAGLVIGRLGCQLSGTWDQTYGIATALPWGWDYGDAVLRHPVAAYELLAVTLLFVTIRGRWVDTPGARFAMLLLGYCVIRLVLEFLKPPYGPVAGDALPVALYAGLTAIQWAALSGVVWFALLFRARRAGGVPRADIVPVT